MRAWKHGFNVKMFCFSHAYQATTNLKQFLSWKLKSYFIYPFLCQLKLGKSLQKSCVIFFFCLSWHFKWENSVFWKASFCKTKYFATRKNFSFNQCHNKEFCVFSREIYFYKSNRRLFSCVCIAWYKHSRGSRLCITVANSPNPSCVYIRLCKCRKRFLYQNACWVP